MALETQMAEQVRSLLTRIVTPIELVASLDDSSKSGELRELLEQIASMSDSVTFRKATGEELDARIPSFAVERTGSPISVRFAGIPLGHEFNSLILALLQVGGHPSKVSAETIDQIAGLSGEHHFETFFSLSCQNCPDVVQALNLMSIINPSITHVAIDGGTFPDEAESREVHAVPTVFCNGKPFATGRMTLEEIIGKLDTTTVEKTAASLTAEEPFDALIVGGGPAGVTSAIYAARKGVRTGLVAERFGGQVLETNSVENLSSVLHTDGPRLAADLRRHVDEYDVKVITEQRATHLSTNQDSGLHTVEFASGAHLRGRTVVLATGAAWRTMGVPGEEEYRNKGVTFCPHCDGPLFKRKKIAVIGGGNSGVEAAIDLAGVAARVTVIEFLDKLGADDVLQRKLRSLDNVDIITGALTTEVIGDGSSVTGLNYTIRATDDSHSLAVEGIFVQIGLVPSTQWLRDSGIELTEHGEIIIDAKGATSLPGVFAAGDCTTNPYKQIVVAFGSGANAALSAFDHLVMGS